MIAKIRLTPSVQQTVDLWTEKARNYVLSPEMFLIACRSWKPSSLAWTEKEYKWSIIFRYRWRCKRSSTGINTILGPLLLTIIYVNELFIKIEGKMTQFRVLNVLHPSVAKHSWKDKRPYTLNLPQVFIYTAALNLENVNNSRSSAKTKDCGKYGDTLFP